MESGLLIDVDKSKRHAARDAGNGGDAMSDTPQMTNDATRAAVAEATKIVPGICPVTITVEKQKDSDDSACIGQTFTVNPDVAIGMLLLLYPNSPWHLFAIDPLQRDLFGYTKKASGEYKPKHTTGGLFNRHNARECARQIVAWQRRGLNVYLHVNELAESGAWQPLAWLDFATVDTRHSEIGKDAGHVTADKWRAYHFQQHQHAPGRRATPSRSNIDQLVLSNRTGCTNDVPR